MGAVVDGDDDPIIAGCAAVAAPRDDEEEDCLDEKTFVSGTILTQYVRRRSVEDLGFAAVLGGEAQGMHSVDANVPVPMPVPVTFAFGRGADVAGVGVGSHKHDDPMSKSLSGLGLIRVGRAPSVSAIVSGIAIPSVCDSRSRCTF